MIRILVEVVSDCIRFTVPVRGESIRKALDSVKERYPGGDARVVFPVDPEKFLVSTSAKWPIELEKFEEVGEMAG